MAKLDDYRPGDTIGDFRVRSLIAVGGMALVYRAVGADGEDAAVKVAKAELAEDEIVRRRFEREAAIAQRLDHPHVVPVLGVGEDRGLPYLAQVYVRGGSLAEKLDREGPLPAATAVRICTQVAGALDALHAIGVVHRDLKPANILLDGRGDAFVTDFGLIKDSQASVLTKPGQALGSIDYMAPEQIHADPVTAATDVYGLACVMMTCLTGSAPFADRQGIAVLWAHIQDPPPDPCALRPELPPALGAALLHGLAKDPADRPPTATEFALALEAALT